MDKVARVCSMSINDKEWVGAGWGAESKEHGNSCLLNSNTNY